MSQAIYLALRSAIETRTPVTVVYRGHRREVCPHVLGRKGEKQHCLVYQHGGTSASAGTMRPGGRGNWRCLDLAHIESLTFDQQNTWYSAPNYDAHQALRLEAGNDAGLRTCHCVDEVELAVPREEARPSLSA